MIRKLAIVVITSALIPLAAAYAKEYPISHKPIVKNGMIISAAYLKPGRTMAPVLPGMNEGGDIHLETDFHAAKVNKQGLQPGTWVPYLTITYHLEKKGGDWETSGPYLPMVAKDGLHYGNNVTLDGPGDYVLTLFIEPPPYAGFFRHTDPGMGVAPWWKPFKLSWTFHWPGTDKPGGDH